jgi:rubrerythrin
MTQHGGAQATGTADEHYDLVSVLYHALQGGETYDKYARDAEQAGDQELAQFFRDVQREDRDRAQRAEQLLAARFPGHQG